MIGQDEYRLAVEHWVDLIAKTTTWPDAHGAEREPFREAPYRDGLEDPTGMPASASTRQFHVLVTGVGPYQGVTTVAGATRHRSLFFNVVVAYHMGGGSPYDERDIRILAAQDCEALKQRLTHPNNFRLSTANTGIISVSEVGTASIENRDEDRILLTMPFHAWIQIMVEAAEGAAA